MTSTTEIGIARKGITLETNRGMRELVDISRIHITTIAALGMLTYGWLFTGSYLWFPAMVCALDWHIVNLVNRVVDLEEDRANKIKGTEFIVRYPLPLLVPIFLILIVSLIIVHLLNPAITGLRVICHTLGILYNWPLLPGKRRLKQFYFWKNTASGVGFLLTVFGYPIATAWWENGGHNFPPGVTWATVLFSALFFFLFEISYEVIYDLRDVKGDTVAGILTYPVVHGERAAIHIVDGLLLSSVAVLVIGYIFGFLPWRFYVMTGAPVVQFIAYKHALHKGISSKDCIRITWIGSGILLFYNLWAIAGLPGVDV